MMNNFTQRTITGAVYVLLLIASVIVGKWTFLILFFLIHLRAMYEYFKMIAPSGKLTFTAYAVIAASLLAYFLASAVALDYININYLVLLLPLIFILLILILLSPAERTQLTGGSMLFPLIYITTPMLFLIFTAFNEGSYNAILVMIPLALIWINDTFAYLAGKLLGKHKIFPVLSPHKTWEGFIGGILFTVLAALVFPVWIKGGNVLQWISLALMVSLTGTAGDLFESALKRARGIKDSSNLLPGHGGILDRIDSFLFVIPFYFVYIKLFIYAFSF